MTFAQDCFTGAKSCFAEMQDVPTLIRVLRVSYIAGATFHDRSDRATQGGKPGSSAAVLIILGFESLLLMNDPLAGRRYAEPIPDAEN